MTQSLPPPADSEPITLRAGHDPPPIAVVDVPPLPGYEILGELGRGGMGVVFKARQIALNRVVALKMVLGTGFASERDAARFRAEAEAVAQLQHPNIVQVYEVGETPAGPITPATPYFAMEYVAGGTLHARLSGRPQPPRASARLIEILARTLHAAHSQGILHRDLKPANVLLIPPDQPEVEDDPHYGVPKLTDFGLAKRLDESNVRTVSHTLIGTPSYMAPEQTFGGRRHGKPLTPATDVYGLGAMLYEMLTGHPPFKGATPADTLLQLQMLDPIPPSDWQPKVPRDLETIALKCLEKAPEHRYQTAQELSDELTRFLAGEPILARPVNVAEKAVKWAKRRPAIASLLGACLAVSLVALTIVGRQWQEAVDARRDADDRARTAAKARVSEGEQREIADAARKRAERARERLEVALYGSHIARARLEWQARGADASQQSLKLCPPALRGWEWRFLFGQQSAALWEFASDRPVHAAAFAPDRSALYVASETVVRYDLQTGTATRWRASGSGSIRALGVAPDGTRVASYGPGDRFVLWDATTGRPVAEVATERGAFAFSPDGKGLAVVGPRNAVLLLDPTNGSVLHIWEPHPQAITGLAFRPDGGVLLLDLAMREPTTTVIQAREVPGGRAMKSLLNQPTGLYSPDGSMVAVLPGEGYAEVWQLPANWLDANPSGPRIPVTMKGQIAHRFRSHDGVVQCTAFSPDGDVMATGGADGTVRVWDLRTGAEQSVWRGPGSGVTSIAFSNDAQLLAACNQRAGTIVVWDRSRHPDYATLCRVGRDIEAIRFLDDGAKVVTAMTNHVDRGLAKLQTWDAASGELLAQRRIDFDPVTLSPAHQAAFAPDGRTLVAASGLEHRAANVYATNGEAPPRVLRGHTQPVASVAVSRDGRLAATSAHETDPGSATRPGELFVWDAVAGRRLVGLREPGLRVLAMAFHPDGQSLAFGGHYATGAGLVPVLALWDWPTDSLIPLIEGDEAEVPLRFAAQSSTDGFAALAFSDDGRRLAVGDTLRRVVVWDLEKRRPHARIVVPQSVMDLEFSPDGTRLAGATRVSTYLWDAETGEERLSLRGAPRAVGEPGVNPKVTFSPDGDRLLASNWDGTLSLFDGTDPKLRDREARRRAAREHGPTWHASMLDEAMRFEHGKLADFHFRALSGQVLPEPMEPVLGEYLARHARWAEAEPLFTRAARRDPDDYQSRHAHAALTLQVRGPDAYREACAALLGQFGRTEHSSAARHVALAATLRPGAADRDEVLRLARLALLDRQPLWAQLAHGAALLRAGRAAEAVEVFAALIPEHEARGASLPMKAIALYYWANAERALGNAEAAANRRKQAEQFHRAQEPGGDLGRDWAGWLIARLARDEK